MKQIANKSWWAAAGVRALKTIAQTAVATIGTSTLIEDVNWLLVLSASFIAGLLSLLTSLAGLPEVDDDSPLIDTSNEDEIIEDIDDENAQEEDVEEDSDEEEEADEN